MSSPSHTSEYSYLGPLSTSTLYGHNEDWQWSPEDQYNHYTYLTSSSTNQEPLDYSIGSSMFYSGEDNMDSSSYKSKTISSDSGYHMENNERHDERPPDEQVFETLGQTVKHDPYQYEDYDELPPQPKKRGRKKKEQNGISYEYINTPEGVKCIKQERVNETFKQRKRMDRFDGMPEEEVMKKSLPDHLSHGLDIVIIGINPGLMAAYKGHHYAGPGNHFWKCLFLAGLIPEPMSAVDDFKLISHGIGFTNIVSRPTKGSADLSRKEIREGAEILLSKLRKYQPKIAVFNGKMIYEVFSGKKNFDFGRQPDPIQGTGISVFVMPSSSARCAQLPRAVDKVPFYIALKKLRDHLCGVLPDLDFSEVSFPDVKLKVEVKEDNHEDCFSDFRRNDVSATVHRSLETETEMRVMIPVRGKRGRKRKTDLGRYPVPVNHTDAECSRPRGRGSGRRGRGRRPVEHHSGYSPSGSSWSSSSTVTSPYFSTDSTPQHSWQHWQENHNGTENSFTDHSQTHNMSPVHNYQMTHAEQASKQSQNNQYYGGYNRPYMGYSQADCSYVPQVDTYAKVKEECYDTSFNEY
ncbi:uncharacterized protein [Parasteatoda tepidariorum]|uniref:uncharacterized protein n=1 Tax=Parasteatoda tepidariorum TaxID=114398 RepID=UPI00077FB899|nr:uncharacterized protein LOC107437527 [Parasteatoda tepidariorum]XP_015905051.1 uncharacterized protein LOC107437527 [Parasteatoda tepidariorum]XP_015905052.1 uncharacterized protein LOC107437527 [Parasteatoda tepidariorum]XP_015905053.1 uncharacterized protein LOC107437527 [Parasteatoda tepidariorum]